MKKAVGGREARGDGGEKPCRLGLQKLFENEKRAKKKKKEKKAGEAPASIRGRFSKFCYGEASRADRQAVASRANAGDKYSPLPNKPDRRSKGRGRRGGCARRVSAPSCQIAAKDTKKRQVSTAGRKSPSESH